MFSFLRQSLVNRWLVQAPAIWGKLPNHGDYIRHRCPASEAQDWQRWVSEVWLRRTVTPRVRPTAKPRQAWIDLKAPTPKPDLDFVPVSFVLLPGTLGFSPKHFIQGVCVASHDSVSRQCPLIIYQKISPYWLRRILDSNAHRHTLSGALNKHDEAAHLLFWLARISARIHAADLPPQALAQLVDEFWRQFEPGWMQLLGAEAKMVNEKSLHLSLARQSIADDSLDTASGLRGVARLPWVNWPQRLLRAEKPVPVFWQQDMQGGYVNASDNLFSLWRNPL